MVDSKYTGYIWEIYNIIPKIYVRYIQAGLVKEAQTVLADLLRLGMLSLTLSHFF